MASEHVQQLAAVGEFPSLEAARDFLMGFEKQLSNVTICRRAFRHYSKVEQGYWFDWVLLTGDLESARRQIRDCFGTNWVDVGGVDLVWNAPDRERIAVPFWAILYEPDQISPEAARQLNPGPEFESSKGFISVSTSGELRGIYGGKEERKDEG